MANPNTPSTIAAPFAAWARLHDNTHYLDDYAEVERSILVATPRSNEDAVNMLDVLLAEMLGERCDGADLLALTAIRDFLRGDRVDD